MQKRSEDKGGDENNSNNANKRESKNLRSKTIEHERKALSRHSRLSEREFQDIQWKD